LGKLYVFNLGGESEWVILKKKFLQGYSEQKKNTCTNKLGGNILPQYLVGKKMLQNSMVAGIDLTSPRRSAGLIFRDKCKVNFLLENSSKFWK
jgi:hypothetical protein